MRNHFFNLPKINFYTAQAPGMNHSVNADRLTLQKPK